MLLQAAVSTPTPTFRAATAMATFATAHQKTGQRRLRSFTAAERIPRTSRAWPLPSPAPKPDRGRLPGGNLPRPCCTAGCIGRCIASDGTSFRSPLADGCLAWIRRTVQLAASAASHLRSPSRTVVDVNHLLSSVATSKHDPSPKPTDFRAERRGSGSGAPNGLDNELDLVLRVRSR